MLSSKHFAIQVKICKQLSRLPLMRCLCMRPVESTIADKPEGDRTRLDTDLYDDRRHVDTEREYTDYQEQQAEEERQIKHRILTAALQFVPKHGWSKQAITSGAEAVGFPPIMHGLVTKGPIELVHHFYQSANQQLGHRLQNEVKEVEQGLMQEKRTRIFIRDAVEYRLLLLVPYIHTWPQAIGLMALPQNVPTSLSYLSHLVDDIWYHAGDRSTDFNYYTKRTTLAGVIKATEMYLLQDQSEDYCNTWKFLDRRLQNLGTVGKTTQKIQDTSGNISNILLGAYMMTKNIIGIGTKMR